MNDETVGETGGSRDSRSRRVARAGRDKDPAIRDGQGVNAEGVDGLLREDGCDEPERPARPPRRRKTVDVTIVPPQPLHRLLSTVGNAAGVRYEILFLLAAKRLDVGTLAVQLDLDQPLVSKHLAQLREAGLVIAAYEHAHRVYALAGNARLVQLGSSSAAGGSSPAAIELSGSDGFAAVLIDKREQRKQTHAVSKVAVSQDPKSIEPSSASPPRSSAGCSEPPAIEVPQPVVRPRARKKPQA